MKMRFKDRSRDDLEREQPPAPAGPGPGGNLAQLRLAGEALLAAGADAITRALSTDSEKFLAANTQQGGQ
jgi:hypothetical protein